MAVIVFLCAALAIFLVGNLMRIVRIATMPVHLRWELYPIPHESPQKAPYGGSYLEEADWWTRPIRFRRSGELKAMLSEIYLLKGVWEYNPRLWLWSWLFHTGLYLLVSVAALSFLGSCMMKLGIPVTRTMPAGFGILVITLIRALSWIAMVFGMAGTLGMIVARIGSSKLRPFTSFGTAFNLLLLLAVFFSGFLHLLLEPSAVYRMVLLAGGLVRLNSIPHVHGIAAIHLGITAFFLAYFPFTHMTHMYLKYFTYHSVRWDDLPSANMPDLGPKVSRYLNYPVSWKAKHIQNDGAKTWAEIIVDVTEKSGNNA